MRFRGKVEIYMKIIEEFRSLVNIGIANKCRCISDIFWDPKNEHTLHNTHLMVYYKEIESITNAIFEKKSMIVYCDRLLARYLGECCKETIEEKSLGNNSGEELSPIESGGMNLGNDSSVTSTINGLNNRSGIRNKVLIDTVRKNEVHILYNFDLISSNNLSNEAMNIDVFYNILEKRAIGARFILFVDPDLLTLPRYFEKSFDMLTVDGISSPACLLPVMTFEEFKKIVNNPIDANSDDLNIIAIDDISINEDKLYDLFNYLSSFTPEQIRVILKMYRSPNEDFIKAVKANRNKYLMDFMKLYSVSNDEIINNPWLEDEKNQIESLLKYSQKNSNKNIHKKIKGIILYGPPGNSKTMLIKSVCQSIGINHIIVSASDIKSKYVGDSEKAIKDLFKKASQAAPCLLVFDEMEALFMSREFDVVSKSGGMLGIVNTLLQEMDSIKDRKNVFVVGTTNKPELIDNAFLRPGRFDKPIEIGYPGREQVGDIVEYFFKLFYKDDPDIFNKKIINSVISMVERRFEANENLNGKPFSVADISYIVKMIEVEQEYDKDLEINQVLIKIITNIDRLQKAMGEGSQMIGQKKKSKKDPGVF